MSTVVRTALSAHKKCFICRRKNVSLFRVKKESICIAYLNYKIVIIPGTRSCSLHLEENGQLKKNFYQHIPTSLKNYNHQHSYQKLVLENTSYQKTIFEKFGNIELLSENDCFSVTRWTKDQFIRFSKYITSIKDNKHRSKEQLIALYKYWLWKGTDQSTLSLLFNFNTNQRQISDYLEQIRIAIFKDFVPFYLGSNNFSCCSANAFCFFNSLPNCMLQKNKTNYHRL